MRLTLRTLLACRDKVLDSADQASLEERIAQNEYAVELLKRMEAVIRNRYLGVYGTEHNDAHIDVETCACYLNDTLAADRIADIERACLVSDVALAEVAACHEILARVVANSVIVPKALRDHLRSGAAPASPAKPSPPVATPTAPEVPQPFREARQSQQRVFISHSSLDQPFVEREIVQLLRMHGLAYWYAPSNIRTASHWERTILEGLQSCDWFLLVMSPRSAESEWVKDELHWAIKKMFGRIIPVIMEACDPFAFHIRLDRIQALDFEQGGKQARRALLAIFQSAEERNTGSDPPAK